MSATPRYDPWGTTTNSTGSSLTVPTPLRIRTCARTIGFGKRPLGSGRGTEREELGGGWYWDLRQVNALTSVETRSPGPCRVSLRLVWVIRDSHGDSQWAPRQATLNTK